MILSSSSPSHIIFDFNKNTDVKNWIIVNDTVMGGKSLSYFNLNNYGYGVFEGSTSLENNGGFSSVRYRLDKKNIKGFTIIKIRLRGDGKKYQFRIKANSKDYHAYVATFLTSGEWQDIQIPIKDMYPTFRGKRLEKPNLSNEYIEEVRFLIGNKKAENFKLLVEKIELE
jgi:hypothetical protein